MKLNKIYSTTWKLFKAFAFVFIAYYIAENIAFTIIYGWHIKAVTELEKNFDMVYGILGLLTQFFFIATLFGVIDYLLSPEKK